MPVTVKDIILNMKEQLLVLNAKNRLISSSFSTRAEGFLFIDELPQELAERLGQGMTFEPLPPLSSSLKDEQTKSFSSHLDEAMVSDDLYSQEMKSIAEKDSIDQDKISELESSALRDLKDRLRIKLGLPKRLDNNSEVNLIEFAKIQKINPSYDLPEPSSAIQANHRDTKIQTLFLKESLDLKLKKLKLKSAENLREQGLSTLYICFGFLEYQDLSAQQKKRLAPLILMPIQFDEKRGSFKISSSDGELNDNKSLRLFLQDTHQLKLPKFPKLDEGQDFIDIEKYLKKINTSVSREKGWRVLRRASIGIFNTSTEVMYEDLIKIADNPSDLLNSLLGGKREESSDALYDLEDSKIRDICPSLIEPADATQHSAVIDMLEGNSFVLRGPPGTGKSQTICNMIGAGLSEGKKILFIARKEAALEVVRSRLTAAELEPFLLKTYSTKSSKGPFWDSVKQRLSLSNNRFNENDFATKINNLYDTKDDLNKYADFMKRPFGKSGLTAHDLIWDYSNLQAKYPSDWIFDELPKPKTYSINQLDTSMDNFKILESDFHPSYANHPFVSAKNVPSTPRDNDKFLSFLNFWQKSLIGLNAQLKKLTNLSGFIESQQSVLDIVDSLNATTVMQELYIEDDRSKLFKLCLQNLDTSDSDIKDFIKNLIELQKLQNKLQDAQLPMTSLGDIPDIIEELQHFKFSKSEDILVQLNDHKEMHETILSTCNPFLEFHNSDAALSFDAMQILNSINNAYQEMGANAKKSINFDKTIFDVTLKKKIDALINAKKTKDELTDINLKEAKNSLAELKADAKIFNDSSLFSFVISSDFRKAKRRLDRISAQPIPRQESASLLFKIAGYIEEESIMEMDNDLHNLFGMEFNGVETSLELLEDLNQFIQSLGKLRIQEILSTSLSAKFIDDTSNFLFSLNQLLPAELNLDDEIYANNKIDKIKDMASELSDWKESKKVFDNIIAKGMSLKILDGSTLKDLGKYLDPINRFIEIQPLVDPMIEALGCEDNEGFKKLNFSVLHEDFNKLLNFTVSHKQFIAKNVDNLIEISSSFALLQNEYLASNRSYDEAMNFIKASPFKMRIANINIDDLNKLSSDAMQVSQNFTSYFVFRKQEEALNVVETKFYEDFMVHHEQLTCKDLASTFKAWIRSEQYRCLSEEDEKHESIFNNFRGLTLDRLREKLKNLDSEILSLTKKYIAFKTQQQEKNAPPGHSSPIVGEKTELELLLYGSKKKTHPRGAVRDHIRRAASALASYSPCWMMTPASVSQFLPNKELFDIVIIDEASQMTPPEALGAIARAKQLVVVGDEHQLPPGTWFQSSNENIADDLDLDVDESILDTAIGVWQNPRMLCYHYRSRHEDLIRFQNNFIYQNQLIIPPTTIGQDSDDSQLGIQSHYLENASYKGKGQNHDEASYVADLVKKHSEARPDQSLGIAAVNKAQEELIRQKIEAMQSTSKDMRNFFSYWEVEQEGLNRPFIKNLANVQGDERDVIIISTAYGKENPGDAVRNNFGPINSSMGHRWLNVLTTRARDQLHLVTSLQSSDVKNPRYRGSEFLKQYLQFAKDKKLVVGGDQEGEIDNPFEQWAVDQITSMGYEAVPQVGVKGFQVDIGVKHPSCAGYILGIECDGAAYHSSPSARDRDILRQSLLEGWGWKIHRIWSTDWLWHPGKTRDKLKIALDKSLRDNS